MWVPVVHSCLSTILCPTVQPQRHFVRRLSTVPVEEREQSPCGDWFVRASRQRGLLPEILEELLAARKRWARGAMCIDSWCTRGGDEQRGLTKTVALLAARGLRTKA